MPVTYYVALPFVPTEDGIAAGQPQECPNERSAIRKAEAMSRMSPNVGALAFKRTIRGDRPGKAGLWNERELVQDQSYPITETPHNI